MIELKPITITDYFNLEDRSEYDFAMKYAAKFTESIDEYGIGEIMELPFGFIKDFQYDLGMGLDLPKMIDYILLCTKRKSLKNEPLDRVCRFSSYLVEGVKKIVENEKELLAHEPSEKELAAGMDRFNEIGIYLQIRSLIGGDITKYEEVRKLPYSLCFTELFASKQLSDYQTELNKLSSPNP